jgi:hypothetical protein
MPRMFEVGSRFVPVSNWALRVPGARLVAHVGLGLHGRRPLPPLVAEPFLAGSRATRRWATGSVGA